MHESTHQGTHLLGRGLLDLLEHRLARVRRLHGDGRVVLRGPSADLFLTTFRGMPTGNAEG